MRKYLEVPEDNLEILQQVKLEQGLRTDSAAMNYIIAEYDRLHKKEKDDDQKLEDFLNKLMNHRVMTRIRFASETAEKNSIYLLDAINTMLQKEQIHDAVPLEMIPSPVIETSKELYKQKLDHFKQQAENRKRKK